jgi:hypothetical protein
MKAIDAALLKLSPENLFDFEEELELWITYGGD